MKLIEVLKDIHNSDHIGCVITDEEIEKLKQWALEMVGEDYPLDKAASFAGLNEGAGRNWEKQKIRQRIEESTK